MITKKKKLACLLGIHRNLGVYAERGQLSLEVGSPYYDGCGRSHRRIYWKCWDCGAEVKVGKTIDSMLIRKCENV
jgi:hypothetical protein